MSAPKNDPYHLIRFLNAQDQVYGTVLGELTNGRKESHWMWFVFPQLRGLGRSEMARFFGISGIDEARAYLAHPRLGPRLQVSTRLAIDAPAADLLSLFGSPDDLKFRSCMTLFAHVADPDAPYGSIYQEALDRWCGGQADPATLALLEAPTSSPLR